MIVKIRTKPTPCRCDEYDFPHRTGGGDCRMKEPFDPSGYDGATEIFNRADRHDSYMPSFGWREMGMGAGQ
jgi:hypothetical protein